MEAALIGPFGLGGGEEGVDALAAARMRHIAATDRGALPRRNKMRRPAADAANAEHRRRQDRGVPPRRRKRGAFRRRRQDRGVL